MSRRSDSRHHDNYDHLTTFPLNETYSHYFLSIIWRPSAGGFLPIKSLPLPFSPPNNSTWHSAAIILHRVDNSLHMIFNYHAGGGAINPYNTAKADISRGSGRHKTTKTAYLPKNALQRAFTALIWGRRKRSPRLSGPWGRFMRVFPKRETNR